MKHTDAKQNIQLDEQLEEQRNEDRNVQRDEQRPLWNRLKELPELPGVYQMLDSKGSIIYIGKSKCLKKRVHTYFVENPKWEKAQKMAPLIYDIRYIVTDTHLEAMLLECELIKREKPHFNVLMKNDEKYVYLTVSGQRQQSEKKQDGEKQSKEARGKLLTITNTRKEYSFGPFQSKARLQDFVDSMENFYPFTEKRKRVQTQYHVFPVKMSEAERNETGRILLKLFSEPEYAEVFIRSLERKMKTAAREEKFETALKYRDLIQGFRSVQKGLREYQTWLNQDFVYTEQTIRGRKYFFIHEGLVVYKELMPEKEEEEVFLEYFKRKAYGVLEKELLKNTLSEDELPEDELLKNGLLEKGLLENGKGAKKDRDNREKEKLDYQNIVYGELFGGENKENGNFVVV